MTSWSYPTPTDHAKPTVDEAPADDIALLRRLGLTPTHARLAVLEQLGTRQPPACALDLHRRLCDHDNPVGQATVYRTLNALTDAGLLHAFVVHGELQYRRCSPSHHHMICIRCGHVWEEQPVAVEHWITDVTHRAHARLIDHRADIFVICQTCDTTRTP